MGTDSCDLSNQFDHIIWAGDLNYRQEKREWWSTQEKYDMSAKADTVTHEEKLDQVRFRSISFWLASSHGLPVSCSSFAVSLTVSLAFGSGQRNGVGEEMGAAA